MEQPGDSFEGRRNLWIGACMVVNCALANFSSRILHVLEDGEFWPDDTTRCEDIILVSNHEHAIHFEGLDFDPNGSLGDSESSVDDSPNASLPTSSVGE